MADGRLEQVTLHSWHSRLFSHLIFVLRYFLENDVEPDEIWTGLCEGSNTAITWCKTFFSDMLKILCDGS